MIDEDDPATFYGRIHIIRSMMIRDSIVAVVAVAVVADDDNNNDDDNDNDAFHYTPILYLQ